MRIGLSSIVGDGFGTGSFQISEIAGVISFPPAGSYNSTLYGVEYPVAQGGTSFANPVTAATVPNQICDVDVENDGAGGTYTDWTTATNIQFKAFGNLFYTDPTPQSLDIEVPSGSGNYYQGGTYYNEFFHDGTGGWSSQAINPSYYSNGTDTNIALVGTPQTTEVPGASYNYFNNGRINGYTWDGNGGYNYPVTKGAYYGNGTDTGLTGLNVPNQEEVPSGSNSFYNDGTSVGYTWDGNGSYNYPVTKGSYYSNGTYIYNDGTYSYYWDGNGGYYYY